MNNAAVNNINNTEVQKYPLRPWFQFFWKHMLRGIIAGPHNHFFLVFLRMNSGPYTSQTQAVPLSYTAHPSHLVVLELSSERPPL